MCAITQLFHGATRYCTDTAFYTEENRLRKITEGYPDSKLEIELTLKS